MKHATLNNRYAALLSVVMAAGLFLLQGCGDTEHDHDHSEGAHNHDTEVHDHSDAHAHNHDAFEEHGHDDAHAHDHANDGGHDHEEGRRNEAADDGHDHDHGGAYAELDETWEELIGLETITVGRGEIVSGIEVPGEIIPDPDRVATVSTFIESSVNRVFTNIGSTVAAGDLLVCLTSPEIGVLRAEYDRAVAEHGLAEKTYKRQKRLYEEKIVSNRVMQEAELALRVAAVDMEYAEKKLMALGMSRDEIIAAPTGHSDAVGSTIHITAPLSGVVTARDAHVGKKAGPHDKLFEIMDLDTVWLRAAVFEKDLTGVSTGLRVSLRVSAFPDTVFYGTIFHIADTLDPSTKTIEVLAAVENTGHVLKPGMFADTRIETGIKRGVLMIPGNAVVEDDNVSIVFVREARGYHRHVVKTGLHDGAFVEILDGLSEGARVVTNGAYQLKSKTRMGAIDPHAGHNH